MAEVPAPIEIPTSTSTSEQPAEFPDFFDPKTRVRRGLCPIMTVQDGHPVESHKIFFEIHGTGKNKIVLIMGLNTSCYAWEGQVPYFAHKDYSVLVFDNKGVGNSDSPKGPYSTTEMAHDLITLLDYVGWTGKRELNVAGVSMGGMIAQELALTIPDRIVSLSLIVTKAGSAGFVANMTPWRGLAMLAKVTFAKDDNYRADLVLPILYPPVWLESKSVEHPDKTNFEIIKARLMHRMSIQRKQTLNGSLSQTAAASGHNVIPSKLIKIDTTIPKVLILSGDTDDLIKPVNSEWLHQHMPRAEYLVWNGFGHGLCGQEPERFNMLLEKVIKEGRETASKAPWA